MWSLFKWATVLNSLAASAMADAEQNDVLELSAANFTITIESSPLVLVEFMAPWCGHCKALKPEYQIAATALKEHSIPLGVVDCTAESTLCSDHGVQGYPTLKVFEHTKPMDYSGPRKADGIVAFMKKRASPVVSIVTPGNHTDFAHSDRIVIVAYLDPADKTSFDAFQSYAQRKRDDFIFGVSYESPSIEQVSSLPRPSIVLWKKFDEGRNDFHVESLSEGEIDKFVSKNAIPLLDEVTPNNFATYDAAGIPLAYLFIEPNHPERESLAKSLEPIAKEFKGKLNFVWIDATQFGDHARSLGLSGVQWPAFAIQDIGAQTKFPMDSSKTIDHDHVLEFVKDFISGKITPSLKSQPIPHTQTPGAYVLVADEFDQAVYGKGNQKDVFIEFYAPWCGHCKRLKPIWDNVAHSFNTTSEHILIAKFDATENDVPSSSGITIHGFPTLKFKPAGSKTFIDYEGDRSLDSLLAFAEQHSVNKVKAVKTEVPEDFDYGTGSEQVVLDNEEPAAESPEEDQDAEHDEL